MNTKMIGKTISVYFKEKCFSIERNFCIELLITNERREVLKEDWHVLVISCAMWHEIWLVWFLCLMAYQPF